MQGYCRMSRTRRKPRSVKERTNPRLLPVGLSNHLTGSSLTEALHGAGVTSDPRLYLQHQEFANVASVDASAERCRLASGCSSRRPSM